MFILLKTTTRTTPDAGSCCCARVRVVMSLQVAWCEVASWHGCRWRKHSRRRRRPFVRARPRHCRGGRVDPGSLRERASLLRSWWWCPQRRKKELSSCGGLRRGEGLIQRVHTSSRWWATTGRSTARNLWCRAGSICLGRTQDDGGGGVAIIIATVVKLCIRFRVSHCDRCCVSACVCLLRLLQRLQQCETPRDGLHRVEIHKDDGSEASDCT